MTSRGRRIRTAVIVLTIITCALAGLDRAGAKIVVPDSSVIEVDDATVKSVVAMFERAEQAVKTRDLNTVMATYSSHYNYHGLKKDDIRKVWKDLFDEYQEIASTHLLTKFTKVGSGAQTLLEVTCTGHLWARSKTSGLYVPIDNLGDSPRVLPFGTSPHPLF
jgi:NAD(P)H-nitrite reductase large subunit